MMDIKKVLLQCFITSLIKKTFAMRANKLAGSGIKSKNSSNKELAEELHKPIIRKSKKKKSTLTFYRHILYAHLFGVLN